MILGLGCCSVCQSTVLVEREKDEDPNSRLVCAPHLGPQGKGCEGGYRAPEVLARRVPAYWYQVDIFAGFGYGVYRYAFRDGGCFELPEEVARGKSFEDATFVARNCNAKEPLFSIERDPETGGCFAIIRHEGYGPDHEGHWDYVREKTVKSGLSRDQALELSRSFQEETHPSFKPGWEN